MSTVNLPWHPGLPVSPELLAVFGCSRTWVSLSVNSCIPWGTFKGFPDGSDGKESTCNAGDLGSIPGLGRPLENGMAPVFLPGEFHGQRSLAGYSPWGCKELATTEQLTHTQWGTFTILAPAVCPWPQSPSLPKTAGGAGENAASKTVLTSSSSSGTRGRGCVTR